MNLATDYLGLKLRSPFVVGASPFCDDTAVAFRLQDAGAGALVMRSLFGEQFDPAARASAPPAHDGTTGAPDSFPEYADYQFTPEAYLRQLRHLKANLSIPIIASLNGHHPGGWVDYAKRLADAGADAIEVNFYQVVTDVAIDADEVEAAMLATVGQLAVAVPIPVAVKLSPFHTAIAQLAVALELAGAAGVVLFNRFYQPDVNIDDLEVQSQLRLSDSSELLLRLRWMAILAPEIRGTLVATGGIHTAADAAKSILTGAHAVQIVSEVLRHGPRAISSLIVGLQQWMRQHSFEDIAQFRGLLDSSRSRNASAFERANYIRTLQSWGN
jgi:dihydroorotate dehydrogenase (fumarate)